MRTFALLAALAVGTALTQQAVACDWNKQVSNAPAVVACTASDCATEPPTDETVIRQDPADCTSGCAKPEPTAPKVTCSTSNCATEEPETQAPTTLACSGDGC